MLTFIISTTLIILILGGAYFFLKKTQKTILVERVFNAPPEKLWKIWTDPELITKWWSPKNFTSPVIKNHFEVGGIYLFSMKSPQGKVSWNTGKYVEIIPNQKIISIMSFSDEKGTPVEASYYHIPGDWPKEIIVTVEFIALEGKTKIKVQEMGIPMVMYIFAKMGWEQQFDKIEKLI